MACLKGEYKAKVSFLKNAALLRQQLEETLSRRIPSAFSPRSRGELEQVSCGIAGVDWLLRGGVPVGMLSEFVGPESSGRTTIALSLLAGVTQSEKVGAWIDVTDTLDPETAAANGVHLDRLLWVRCGARSEGVKAVSQVTGTSGVNLSVSISGSAMPVRGGGSPHPRSEGNGMSEAIGAMMEAPGELNDKPGRSKERSIGTPGAVNRPLVFRSPDREEQVSSDRLPSHRARQGTDTRFAEPPHAGLPGSVRKRWTFGEQKRSGADKGPKQGSWDALDQALKTTDLLLQGGGFSMIVLDLGSIPAEMSWRIPLATWFRFRAACERTQVSLLVLTQHPCTRSSAGVVIRMCGGEMKAQRTVMTGIAFRAEVERQSFESSAKVTPIRKRAQSEHGVVAEWTSESSWAVIQ